jgi:hypothetical protein
MKVVEHHSSVDLSRTGATLYSPDKNASGLSDSSLNQPLYDEESKGNLLKFFFNFHYYVKDSIILGKVYQVAPWNTWKYVSRKSANSFFHPCVLFPLKLFCHFSLIVLLCCLLLFMNNQYGSYHRGMSMVSCGFFLPFDVTGGSSCEYSDCVGYLSSRAATVEDYSCSLYKVKFNGVISFFSDFVL